jgi:hypothetical protein
MTEVHLTVYYVQGSGGESVLLALKRLLVFLHLWPYRRPPGAARDPYAWRPVPRKPHPKPRSDAVALLEPDE